MYGPISIIDLYCSWWVFFPYIFLDFIYSILNQFFPFFTSCFPFSVHIYRIYFLSRLLGLAPCNKTFNAQSKVSTMRWESLDQVKLHWYYLYSSVPFPFSVLSVSKLWKEKSTTYSILYPLYRPAVCKSWGFTQQSVVASDSVIIIPCWSRVSPHCTVLLYIFLLLLITFLFICFLNDSFTTTKIFSIYGILKMVLLQTLHIDIDLSARTTCLLRTSFN